MIKLKIIPKSSNMYLKLLILMLLGAPRILSVCVAILYKKTRLLRYTRNDNSYRWIRNILSCSIGIIFSFFIFSCSFPRIIVLDDPLSPEEHLNLGVTYERNGEFDHALKEYHTASKKLPLAYLYIGNIYFHKNEYEEAEKYYIKAITKDVKNADLYNNLAWLYYTKGENLEEAERLALKALRMNAGKSDIYQDTLEKIRERKQTRDGVVRFTD